MSEADVYEAIARVMALSSIALGVLAIFIHFIAGKP